MNDEKVHVYYRHVWLSFNATSTVGSSSDGSFSRQRCLILHSSARVCDLFSVCLSLFILSQVFTPGTQNPSTHRVLNSPQHPQCHNLRRSVLPRNLWRLPSYWVCISEGSTKDDGYTRADGNCFTFTPEVLSLETIMSTISRHGNTARLTKPLHG